MGLFSKRLGIDLGTVNTLIYHNGKIALNEPSVVAVDERDGELVTAGHEAYLMIGRTPGNIRAIHPIRNGVIADFDMTEKMLTYFIRKVIRRKLVKPNVAVAVSLGSTTVEKRAVIDAMYNAGNKDIVLVESPLSAALGAEMPIWDATGQMLVDIGGGTSDVVVISLGSVVQGVSIKVAGDAIDDAIIYHIKRRHNVLIGKRTAEDLKKSIGAVESTGQVAQVSGQHVISGLPTSLEISSDELVQPISEPASEVVTAIRHTLEMTPPELASDILDRGIVLTGGGSLLKGLAEMIERETGLTTHRVDEPLLCVARGTGEVLSRLPQFKRSMNQKKLA